MPQPDDTNQDNTAIDETEGTDTDVMPETDVPEAAIGAPPVDGGEEPIAPEAPTTSGDAEGFSLEEAPPPPPTPIAAEPGPAASEAAEAGAPEPVTTTEAPIDVGPAPAIAPDELPEPAEGEWPATSSAGPCAGCPLLDDDAYLVPYLRGAVEEIVGQMRREEMHEAAF